MDNDGRIDMIVTVLNGPLKYFHNVTGGENHWITLNLVGTKSNRMGLGAQVHVTTEDGKQQWNEATTAVGYASSSDPRVHFGLGANKKVREIEIRWPSGTRQVLRDVDVDRVLRVEEPKDRVPLPPIWSIFWNQSVTEIQRGNLVESAT
jgi:hypothetical protein